MANVVTFLLELATDAASRARFRSAPANAVLILGDGLEGGLSGEDVVAAASVTQRRLDGVVAERIAAAETPSVSLHDEPGVAAVVQLLAFCDAVDPDGAQMAVGQIDMGVITSATSEFEPDLIAVLPEDHVAGSALPDHPPGIVEPRLWAVGDFGDEAASESVAADRPREVDPDHPTVAEDRVLLAPVPEPEGGFEASVLEIVEVVSNEHGVASGTRATVVSVRRDPLLAYEVEISDENGIRLVVLPHDAVERIVD